MNAYTADGFLKCTVKREEYYLSTQLDKKQYFSALEVDDWKSLVSFMYMNKMNIKMSNICKSTTYGLGSILESIALGWYLDIKLKLLFV